MHTIRRSAECTVSSSLIGLGCLLFFAISQGARDAFFGNLFQSVSFLLIAVLAFGGSVLVFTAIAFYRKKSNLTRLLESKQEFAALNVTTAAAWLSFFFGLQVLEPAVVATLYNGVGPLAVLGLHAAGCVRTGSRPSPGEWVCYTGIAATLIALVVVVLTNRSGLAASDFTVQSGALVAVILGGAVITIGHVVARGFTDRGVGSDAIMGMRFLLALGAAGVLELALGGPSTRPSVDAVLFLAAMAFALVILPSFLLQLGVARASPLAVNVFRALGPVFVFVVQQLDGRLRFSGPTLGCIIVFCVCAISASVLRGWSEARGPAS
jgi:drug/metabolite transporter (DMT)-like permease